jgi:hypothetical protein
VVPTEVLKITGQTKYYDTKGDSGHIMSRGFCPDCGGRLFGKTKAMPDLTVVLAGSLDDPSWYRPGMNIYRARSLGLHESRPTEISKNASELSECPENTIQLFPSGLGVLRFSRGGI